MVRRLKFSIEANKKINNNRWAGITYKNNELWININNTKEIQCFPSNWDNTNHGKYTG